MVGRNESPERRIGAVVRKVNRVLVSAERRGELLSAVCETLVDADPYVFAWVGTYDEEADRVCPRAAAGVDTDYLDEISIAVREDPDRQGPTATAIRTGTIQVLQDIPTDPEYEPWRTAALERGYRSSVAIPLLSGDRRHGVLNLYADREAAFDESELTLVTELGETIANAIDRLEARTTLEAEKDRFERLVERVSDGYHAVDNDWRITYWNDEMTERTAKPAQDVVGEVLWEAFPQVLDTQFEREYRAAMTDGQKRTFQSFVEEPFEYWVEVDVYPDEEGLSIFSREITERKRREAELERAERRLDAIVENTAEAIFLKDLDGRYLFINEAGADVFDEAAEDIVGRDDHDLFDPESARAIREDDREVMTTGESRTWERVRDFDGDERVFVNNKFPYRNESGEIVGIVGVSHEVSERKRYERLLEDRTEKLEVLNRIVRHDIRNDMQTVRGLADVLEGSLDGDEQRYAKQVVEKANHVVELTQTARGLLETILDDETDLQPTRLAPVLETEVAAIDSRVSVSVETPVPDVSVLADELLGSVFRNLLANAVQHNPSDDPHVWVSVDVRAEADELATPSIVVSVADDGPGIAEDRKEQIFDKGTLGSATGGTGIGLYLVDAVIERYGGSVTVRDNEPRGTVFEIALPQVE